MPGFCWPFGLFCHFWGVFRCFSQLSVDEVKAGHCCFKRPGPWGCFLAKIQIRCSIFPSNAKKDSPSVPFSSRLGKIFKLFAPIGTIFASLLELSTLRHTLWLSSRLQHSLKSTSVTAPAWGINMLPWGRWERVIFFNRNFWLCARLVSHICHAGAVASVDFKLCRSLEDGHKVWRKVESSGSEAKIVQIGVESLKIFLSWPKKGTNGLSFFALEGKVKQQIQILVRKPSHGPGLSKQQCPALTSSIESSNKHLKTPQKWRNRPNGQQKPGKVSIFSSFYSRKVTFYFIAQFYPSLFLIPYNSL